MNLKLPFISRKVLELIPSHLREEIEGDLVQRYQKDVGRIGIRRAKMKAAWASLKFLRPGIMFRKNQNRKTYPVFMFRNYFVVAVRNLMAHKMNSGINMLSLIIGITSAIVMISVIRYELSFDSFHTNSDRIYRITRDETTDGDYRGNGVAFPLADVFRTEVSAIENITGVQFYGGAQVDTEVNGEVKKFKEPSGTALVDNEFFNVFDFNGTDFKWIAGNREKALVEPFTVVITESIAKKYFGDADPLGKTLRIEAQVDTKVTGVITDLPSNSDFPFTILVSYPTLHQLDPEQMKDDWASINANHTAYVLLPKGTSVEDAEAQFDKVHEAHVSSDMANKRKYRLQPLSDIHQNPDFGTFNRRTVDAGALWIMGITGLLLLMVGCINYINIATAQSTLRSKEIGVRKVLGGQRRQLILQFLSETFVLVAGACVLSLLFAELALMNLSTLTNMPLKEHLFADPFILTSLGVLILVITAMSGFYPAIAVSAYSITSALKGLTGSAVSSAYLRKTLVVVQFAVTQAFLIGAFIVINQLQFSRTMDMGFNSDLVVNIPIGENGKKNEDLRNMLLTSTAVGGVSLSSSLPSGDSRNHWFVGVRRKETAKNDVIAVEYQAVDTSYFNLFGIKVMAGRNFLKSDSLDGAIVNRTLVRKFGFATPEDAIGQPIAVDDIDYTIVGVIDDFHNQSVRDKISEMVFVMKPRMFYTSSIRLSDPTRVQESIVALQDIWAAAYPSMLFEYRFFDDNIEAFYKEERKLSKLLQIFSGVFLLLACLGLYGLLSFVVNRRMKEVAVRKVFGAGVAHIVGLISKDYVVLILVSFAIAAPASWYLMNQWLENFEFHIPITWWILIAPGAVALAIAMITLSGKLLRAASKNPAETLKYE